MKETPLKIALDWWETLTRIQQGIFCNKHFQGKKVYKLDNVDIVDIYAFENSCK